MKAYGARMTKVYQQQRRDQRLWFAEACRQEHMLLTAEGGGEMATDLSLALDGYTAFEHALPLALGEDAVALVAKSGTFYSPTLLVAYGGPWGEQYFWQTRNPHDDARLNRFVPHLSLDVLGRRHIWVQPEEYHFPTVAAGAARVLRPGGNVVLGAHGQLQGLGVHWELWAMAGEGGDSSRSGMTPHEALGVHGVADLLRERLTAAGGELRLGAPVRRILIDGGRATGVVTAGGERLPARWVVSNADYKTTFLDLLDPADVPSLDLAALRAVPYTGSEFAVYLGVRADEVDFSAMRAEHLFYRHAGTSGADGDPADFDDRDIEICLWSRKGPDLAPPGKASLALRAGFPYERFAGWRLGEKQRRKGYVDHKAGLARKLVRTAEHVLPGLAGAVEVMEAATPLTYRQARCRPLISSPFPWKRPSGTRSPSNSGSFPSRSIISRGTGPASSGDGHPLFLQMISRATSSSISASSSSPSRSFSDFRTGSCG